MQALAKKKTQEIKDLYFPVTVAQEKLSNHYAEVTPTTGLLLFSAHILDHLQKLRSISKWDKAMDINPEDKTTYPIQ